MSGLKKRVLIADDVAKWRRFAASLLSDRYDIEFADDFESVLERLLWVEAIDAIVLDFLMPGTPPFDDGCQVCSYLRDRFPKIEVVVYTGAWQGTRVNPCRIEEELNVPVVFKPDRKLRSKIDELLHPGTPGVQQPEGRHARSEGR